MATQQIIGTLILLLLSSCTHYSEAAFARLMEPWKGRSEKDLVSHFGYPNQQLTSPDGHRVFEYRSRVLYVQDSFPNPPHRMWLRPSRHQILQYHCTIWIEVQDKRVKDISWRGNNCVAEETEDQPESPPLPKAGSSH